MASPNVPDVPGVPALNRIGAAVAPIVLLLADAGSVLALLNPVKWGLYDQNGRPVITASNVKAVGFRGESRISNYPIENGGFRSYNKVQTPNGVRITYTCGRSLAERTAFIDSIEAAKRSIKVFQVITPEATYQRMNVTDYDYDRTARSGVSLLTVDVICEEIQAAPSLQFTTTGAPDAAGVQNGGTVQPSVPTTSDIAIVHEELSTIAHVDLPPL